MTRCREPQRGQALVLFVVMVPILLCFVALSVDVVYALLVKAALVTATDSAALAGVRASVNGQAAVTAAVERTFRTNLPDGGLIKGSASYTPNPPLVTLEADGSQSLTLIGAARSPAWFLSVLGYNGMDVKAYAKASRRDVNLMLVLDRSGSLVTADAWDDVQAASTFFVQQFDDVHDKVGLVSFGTNSRVDYSPQTSFKSPLTSYINNMEARTGNFTNSSLALYLGYNSLRTLNEATAQNIIVFFTDGRSTAMPGQNDVRLSGDVRCPASPQDGVFHTNHDGSGSVWGIFGLEPAFPPGTWPSPTDKEIIPGCHGLRTDGGNGTVLLSGGFRDTWVPPYGPATPISIYGLNPVSLSSIDDGHNVINIAENLMLNVAQKARQDPLKVRILVIGLGNDINEASLQRVANVQPYTVSGQPVGVYVYAPDHTQLMNAFRQVASSISHLVQ